VAITLPYTFDTTAPFRGVMKFVAWLEVVVVIGILHSLLVRHSAVTAAGFGHRPSQARLVSFSSGSSRPRLAR
jgi:hypothetical protein